MTLKIVSRYHIECKRCGEQSPFHSDKKTELKEVNKSLKGDRSALGFFVYTKEGVCWSCDLKEKAKEMMDGKGKADR